MLDNLVNPNLAGLSGNINYSYTYDSLSQSMPTLLCAIAGIVILVFFLSMISKVINGSKTKQYREQLTDMYVAGMIRKIAKEDSIDLSEEYKTFVTEHKKAKLAEKALDNVVEQELSEKIVNESEKKINKK